MRGPDYFMIQQTLRPFVIALALALLAQCPSLAGVTDSNSLVRAGYQQICQGEHEQAIETLTAALRADPASIDARRYLAYALLHAGLAEQAVTQFETVNKMNPGSTADLTLLGDAYFYAGQYQKAVRCYQQALNKDSNQEKARAGLVHTYVALGDTKHATLICQQGLQQARTPSTRGKYMELMRDVQGDPNIQPQVLDE